MGEFKKNEYLKSIKLLTAHEADGPFSDKMKLEISKRGREYNVKRLVLCVSVSDNIKKNLAKEKSDINLKDEKIFLKNVFESWYNATVLDDTFEERLCYSLENSYNADLDTEKWKYPFENKNDLKNPVTQYIGRTKRDNEKSKNLVRLENPEINYIK